MKKLVLLALYTLSFFVGFSQVKDADPQLNKRLNEYMLLNEQLNFTELLTYVHPNLFKLSSREEILKSFEEAFNNEYITITIDSSAVFAIGKSFLHKGGTYKKVDYFMKMQLAFKDTSVYNSADFIKQMQSNLQQGFPGKSVSYNEKNKIFVVAGNDVMIAIKDAPTSEWMFLGVNNNEALVKALFDPEVIEHFKLL